MKKAVFTAFSFFLVFVLAACVPAVIPGETSLKSSEQTSEDDEIELAFLGTTYETDKFSVMVPDGWNVMDVEGGVQIYKMSGEVFELHYRGYNQHEDHAKQQVEWLAEQYDGTAPKEVDLFGKRFWTTSFVSASVPQVSYLCMEDGEMLSVKYGGPDYQNNPVFEAILDSIQFK